MKRVARGPLTEAAEPLDLRSVVQAAPEADSPALLWAQLRAVEQALPDALEQALRRLVGEELALAPNHVRATAAELWARAHEHQGPFVLRVHPEDRHLLQGLPTDVDVEDDETLERGGCVLSTPSVELDGSLQTRLTRVLAALRGEERP